jgi:T5SS/PEP-CTERM-associated repeat protein
VRDWIVAGLLLLPSVGQAQYASSFQTNTISGLTRNWLGNYVIGTNTYDHDVLIVKNAGVLTNANGYLGRSSSSGNNSAVITGASSIWSNNGALYIGEYGPNNQLTITNGGAVNVVDSSYIGLDVSADNNIATITGNGSVWHSGSSLNCGALWCE